MAYMLLILEERGDRQARGVDEGRVVYDRMLRFAADLRARGVLKGGEALKSDSERVRVQVRDSKQTQLDGPFAEAKEFLAGFWIVDCETRERAYEIAARASAAPGPGGAPMKIPIEVREVMSAPLVEV